MAENTNMSIIIAAYNEEKFLPQTLSEVSKANNNYAGNLEVIVVDNNSQDNTARIAEDHGAKVVFEEHNQISRARNAGAKVSNGDYLVFLDADIVKLPNNLFSKIGSLMTNGSIGGGSQVAFDSHWELHALASVMNYTFRNFKYTFGLCMFSEKKSFDELGGFREDLYFMEDIDFQVKLRNKGKNESRPFVILDEKVVTSGRKIEDHGRARGLNTYLHPGIYVNFFGPLLGFNYRVKGNNKIKYWYDK